MFFYLGIFNKVQNTPLDGYIRKICQMVLPGKEVPFGGLDDYILYLDPKISENPPFRGLILQPKTALTRGCFNIYYP